MISDTSWESCSPRDGSNTFWRQRPRAKKSNPYPSLEEKGALLACLWLSFWNEKHLKWLLLLSFKINKQSCTMFPEWNLFHKIALILPIWKTQHTSPNYPPSFQFQSVSVVVNVHDHVFKHVNSPRKKTSRLSVYHRPPVDRTRVWRSLLGSEGSVESWGGDHFRSPTLRWEHWSRKESAGSVLGSFGGDPEKSLTWQAGSKSTHEWRCNYFLLKIGIFQCQC